MYQSVYRVYEYMSIYILILLATLFTVDIMLYVNILHTVIHQPILTDRYNS